VPIDFAQQQDAGIGSDGTPFESGYHTAATVGGQTSGDWCYTVLASVLLPECV
jgi:hypothetical protein